VSWSYDTSTLSPQPDNPIGRLTKVIDASAGTTVAETRFAYDAMGRTSLTQRIIDGVTYNMSQTYDALSRITSETFPDADSITYSYNTAGWLSAVSGYVNSIIYNARGQRTQIQYANGVTTNFSYNAVNFRLTQRQTGGAVEFAPRIALTSWVKSWTTLESNPPSGYSNLYRGGICVANSSGACVGGDSMVQSGIGPIIGYIKNTSGTNTVPVYQSTCYSSGGSCTGWGLSLTANGTAVGYLSTTAPDSQSAAAPFVQSNGLLLQGLTGTASAYLWSAQLQTVNHTEHIYSTDGSTPNGYTSTGTTGYLLSTSTAGSAPLYRYVNSTTGYHYYSTVSDAPSGFTQDALLGYVSTSSGTGLVGIYRHFNSTTGDYLLSSSSSPPSGYALQATLGYMYTNGGGIAAGSHQNLSYAYDNVGNITFVTDGIWTGSRSFTYDNLNRLTQASGTFGQNLAQVTHSYSYDAIGNILQKNGILYYYCNHPIQPASAQDCTGAIHPSAVVATSDGRSYTYDTNSNTATGTGRTFTWNVDNRVSQVIASGGTIIMNYDYTGIRVKKTGPGGTTYFPFSGYEIDPSGVVTKYIRTGVETLAAKKGSEKLFYHNDHLGGVNVITDIFGARVQLTEYDPWGKVSRLEGLADPNKRFNGKELDLESGLYYYGGRYSDPDLARFVSPDPFVSDPDDPQNLNRYSYVLNNPANYIDPSGYFHRHHKSGGFFGSIFGRIFMVIFDFAMIFAGLPPGLEGGIGLSTFVGLARLGPDLANLAQTSNDATGVDTPGAPPGVFSTISGGGYFSPSLMLAARAGCDVCSDSGWDWLRTVLDAARSLLNNGVAEASDEGERLPPSRRVPPGAGGVLRGPRAPGQPLFEIHPRVPGQLNDPRLGSLAGKLTPQDVQNLAIRPSALRVYDVRSGYINVIQPLEGMPQGTLLRITVPRDTFRIISVGPIRQNGVINRLATGDFVPLP
jgi:RHS repeat-associated protein